MLEKKKNFFNLIFKKKKESWFLKHAIKLNDSGSTFTQVF